MSLTPSTVAHKSEGLRDERGSRNRPDRRGIRLGHEYLQFTPQELDHRLDTFVSKRS
jgi:hypothetical protein